jgi:hypothetical protein
MPGGVGMALLQLFVEAHLEEIKLENVSGIDIKQFAWFQNPPGLTMNHVLHDWDKVASSSGEAHPATRELVPHNTILTTLQLAGNAHALHYLLQSLLPP